MGCSLSSSAPAPAPATTRPRIKRISKQPIAEGLTPLPFQSRHNADLIEAVRQGNHEPIIPRDTRCDGIVNEVIDGDTVSVCIRYGSKFKKVRLRVDGVDTPEVRTKSELEKTAGFATSRVVARYCNPSAFFFPKKPGRPVFRRLVSSHLVVNVHIIKPDKFGDRWVGSIKSPHSSETLSEYLLKHRLAHKYDGRTKKTPWLPDELNAIIETEAAMAKQ